MDQVARREAIQQRGRPLERGFRLRGIGRVHDLLDRGLHARPLRAVALGALLGLADPLLRALAIGQGPLSMLLVRIPDNVA